VGPEATLAHVPQGVFGTNVGNVLFSDAVHRLLSVPGTEVVSDAFTTERPGTTPTHVARINDEFDHVALPLANAFRGKFVPTLDRLSSVIERLKVPVSVIGVGAQFSLDTDGTLAPKTTTAVTRFMRAVLDRSPSVGVRGEVTRTYLRSIGFGDEHVTVIGCPSVYLRGPDNFVRIPTGPLGPEARIALNVTPTVERFAPVVEAQTKANPNLFYVPQETDDLAMMLWGEDRPGAAALGMPTSTDHPLYAEDRMRFPLDSRTWIKLLEGADFAFGTRIHGTIAALLARTPATLVAFDSRTLELAEYHEIPFRLSDSISDETDAAELYESSNWRPYNAGLARRFATLTTFLESNRLAHVYQPGLANPGFDRAVAEAHLPAPVHPLVPASPEYSRDVVSRLRWLRQGAETDRHRRDDGFTPPFAPGRAESTDSRVTALQRELRETTQRLEEQIAKLQSDRADHGETQPSPVRRAARSFRARLDRPS
jgi:hypothetical protein